MQSELNGFPRFGTLWWQWYPCCEPCKALRSARWLIGNAGDGRSRPMVGTAPRIEGMGSRNAARGNVIVFIGAGGGKLSPLVHVGTLCYEPSMRVLGYDRTADASCVSVYGF